MVEDVRLLWKTEGQFITLSNENLCQFPGPQRAVLLERSPEFREPRFFVVTGSTPILSSRRVLYVIMLDSTCACPLLQRETPSLPFKAVQYIDILENIVKSKEQLVPLLATHSRESFPSICKLYLRKPDLEKVPGM